MDLEQKIANFLEKIGIDRALHFLIGWSIVSTCFAYTFQTGCYGFVFTVFIAIFKEVKVDQKADSKDAIATVLGGLVAFLVCSLLYWIGGKFGSLF